MSEGFGLKSFKVNVATAGTRVQLSSTTIWAEWVQIIASTANAGAVYIGGSNVAAANGFPLSNASPNNRVDLGQIFMDGSNESWDLSKIYIDAANNDEDVFVIYSLK
jgi:hypothetical protein